MRLNKKGSSVGMVFIFIVAAVTFAVIMIFGYKMITEFVDQGEQVEFFQFKTDIETSIKKIYTEYGSVRIEEFNLPLQYNKICFIDLETPYPGDDVCFDDVYACDVWKSAGGRYDGADENIFLDPGAPIKLKAYHLQVSGGSNPGILCLPIEKGSFTLKLEGRGDRTLISPAPR